MNKFIILPFIFMLGGCATAYQSSTHSITGGYLEDEAPGKLKKISFSGNGYIDSETVQKYALFRSAEYANQLNMPYFIIYGSLMHAAADQVVAMPTVGQVGGKPTAFSFVLPISEPREGAKKTSDVLEEMRITLKAQAEEGAINE